MSKFVCFVVALAMSAFVFAADEITDDAFDAALTKAMAAPLGEAEFRSALQSVAPRFVKVDAATEPGKATWTEQTLNERGKKIDAIRVRTPAGDKRDLVWAFSVPASVERWYILPVEGEMKQGFRNFWRAKPAELFGKESPAGAERGFIQMLDARQLEPGKEYLLWFVFTDEKPAKAWVTLAFLPPGKSNSSNAAAKGLGLPRAAETSKAETPKGSKP